MDLFSSDFFPLIVFSIVTIIILLFMFAFSYKKDVKRYQEEILSIIPFKNILFDPHDIENPSVFFIFKTIIIALLSMASFFMIFGGIVFVIQSLFAFLTEGRDILKIIDVFIPFFVLTMVSLIIFFSIRDYKRKNTPEEKFLKLILRGETFEERKDAFLSSGVSIDHRFIQHENATALMVASFRQNLPAVEFLLSQKANPNLQDDLHQTALYLALNGSENKKMGITKKIIEILLKHGADPNIRDDAGGSILHILLWYFSGTPFEVIKELIILLLQHGADPTIKDNEGKTPIDYAKGTVYEELFRRGYPSAPSAA